MEAGGRRRRRSLYFFWRVSRLGGIGGMGEITGRCRIVYLQTFLVRGLG